METFDELFYREPYTREFDARVVACDQTEDGWEVELDQTAFYPLGGGQPGDRGTLVPPDAPAGEDDAAVVHVRDTQKRGDRIVHLADQPLAVDTQVHGALDWTWRRDNMEAHTGEHVVSGIVHALYGYDNVGFHMGDRCIEVDFDGVLTEEQTLDVERRANAAVREDLPVQVLLPSPDELQAMDYRSKKELEGVVRIVSIPGVDACACCGTHVATTGQVGLIKILRITTKKKKTRLELLCGRRALEAVEDEMAQLRATSNYLSVGDDEVLDAVQRLSAEKDGYKHELRQAHHQAIDREVQDLGDQGRLLVHFAEGADIEEQRYFCEQALGQGVAQVCAVLAPADAGRWNYVLASTDVDLRPLVKELNARLSGRGGGKPHMVQGSFAATREDVEAALQEVLG